jgi:hypothetical protein
MFSHSNIHSVALKREPAIGADHDKIRTRLKYAVDILERLLFIGHVLENLIHEGTVE